MTAPDPGPVPADPREEIDEYRRRYATPGMTAGEFYTYLPERLRTPYWRIKIEEVLDGDDL